MGEVCLVSCADSVFKEVFYVVEVQAVLVDDELAAVRESADAESASGTGCNLFPVLCNDVHESPSYCSEAGDEEVDVLSASLVEELVVDGADSSLCIFRRYDHRDVSF